MTHMARSFPWKRFWCRREDSFVLSDGGFLTDPEQEYGRHLNPNLATLDDLQSTPCIALLGEPGVGKSWSLSVDLDRYVRDRGSDSVLRLDLRGFGSEDRLYGALFGASAFLAWAAGDHVLNLYIDSLDECLLRIDNVAALLADELLKYPLDRLKLRIACRTASWPPLLEAALRKGYGDNGFAAHELVPLRRRDNRMAATLSDLNNPDAFLQRIEDLQIASLAIKPVTLALLLDTYARNGDLPGNVLDLYELGCLALCEEQSPSRRSAGRRGDLSPRDRVAVSMRLAAATQLGNRDAVWTGLEWSTPGADVSIPELLSGTEFGDRHVNIETEAILEALGTGLFSSRGSERLGWSHQTYAEFLAARYCLHHRLPIQQIRSLIFHPRRKRVVPQVREVASWIALQNHDIFRELAASDPEVLLGSAAPNYSPEQRAVATAALMNACERGRSLHTKRSLDPLLRNLEHEGLAEQLLPYMTDRSRLGNARLLAVTIARKCKVMATMDVLADIAVDDTEAYHLRSMAAFTVSELGLTRHRARLAPLLLPDPHDDSEELKGAALRAIWPGVVYDDSMWQHLTPPRRHNLYGLYHSFVAQNVLGKLHEDNIAAALRWYVSQLPEELGAFHTVQEGILLRGLQYVQEDGVACLLAAAIKSRIKSGIRTHSNGTHDEFAQLLAHDDVRRRTLLSALLPLLDEDSLYQLTHPLPFLLLSDLDWLLERILHGTSPDTVDLEAKMVCRLAAWEYEPLEKVYRASQLNSSLQSACSGLFMPASLNSDLALFERELANREEAEGKVERATALKPRVEAALIASERGKPDRWLALLNEMSVEEGGTHYIHFTQMTVEELPGWKASEAATRVRILDAAKRYLEQSTFPAMEWPANDQAFDGSAAGVNALVLLQQQDCEYLRARQTVWWKRWINSLVGDYRVFVEGSSEQSALQKAAEAAPMGFNERAIEQIGFDSRKRSFFQCLPLLTAAWSQSLGSNLFAEIQGNVLRPGVQGDVLSVLLQKGQEGVRVWAEGVVRAEHRSERGEAFSRSLLAFAPVEGWSVLWPLIQVDPEFGRSLLEGASYGSRDASTFTQYLSDHELADLLIWLLDQYPPDDHPRSGVMGPRDTVRFLRDGTLEALKKRASFEACDGLSQAILHFPQYPWLEHHFDEAELLACAATWAALAPRDIVRLAEDSTKRGVESSAQLLDLLLESLERLQVRLHDELPAVVDLWFRTGDAWRPKDEEDVSDYIARFFRDDLRHRGIVINREVQIRRGPHGEMPGQSTDIHVDAIATGDRQPGIYGLVSVIVEVKGCWNAGLMTDMEVQLRDRYLRNSTCRTGLYLVAHFRADSWARSDRRRRKCNLLEPIALRSQLAEQARALSGGAQLESFVLDMALNSTLVT